MLRYNRARNSIPMHISGQRDFARHKTMRQSPAVPGWQP